MNETGIRWTSRTIRVDIDTGDILTKHTAETQYVKIKTLKHGETNRQRTKGVLEYTQLYKRKQQLEIFGANA